MAEETERLLTSLNRRWNEAAKEVQAVCHSSRSAKSDRTKVDTFKGLYRVLEKYYSRFEDLTEELYTASANAQKEFPTSKHQVIIDNVKSYYFESHENYEKLVASSAIPSSAPNVTVTENRPSSSHLPKLSIPKFDGELINWPKFRDAFTSMVHSDESLSSTQKFHYLVNAITGNARSIIHHLNIEEANYAIAWDALKQAFDNKRMLASVYLNHLLSFKPNPGKPTLESYKLFINQISDNIAAFKLLKVPNDTDFILFHLAARCLDQHTREQFEITLDKTEFPTIDNLTKFVRDRLLALQLSIPNMTFNHQSTSGSNSNNATSNSYRRAPKYAQPYHERSRTSLLANSTCQKISTSSPPARVSATSTLRASRCVICLNGDHTIPNCATFHTIPVTQRVEALRNWHGCKICLSDRHTSTQCQSKYPCRFCKRQHNSFLCLEYLNPKSTADGPSHSTPASSKTNSVNLLGATLNSEIRTYDKPQVVLGTAWADFQDARGQFQKVRLVVDSASQYSYMTQRCLSRLGLDMVKGVRKISCLGGTMYEGAKGVVSCHLRPTNNSSVTLTTEAVVVKTITSFLPSVPIPRSIWKKYLNFELADPKFFHPLPIDFLLGADLITDVLTGSIESVGETMPKMLSSVFGYIIIGKYFDEPPPTGTSLLTLNPTIENLSFDLEKFWKLEEVHDQSARKSPADARAEEIFINYHYRLPNGRFVVRLPFNGPVPSLTASELLAKKQFQNLELKFRRDPQLKAQYTEFMEEYIDLNHMEPTSKESKYVIPHHGIFKIDRNKLKIRVVFNGSASCGSDKGALNDYLLIGEPLQNDIRNILINFRAHMVVWVADAVKMYRQILIAPSDRDYQHIYWRANPCDVLRKYELKTLTYGMACSPHLALRCIKQLQMEHADERPLASTVLSRDIFVDDIVTGADSVSQAIELQREVIETMARGCFTLGKWASNSKEVLQSIDSNSRENIPLNLDSDDRRSLKVLGLKWDPQNDVFSYNIHVPETVVCTKRAIMSTVASIFDPLGFVSPAVLLLKSHIQELWTAKVDWDERIPDRLAKSWLELMTKIPMLAQIKVQRFVCAAKPYQYQVVGFSDASNKAYCASIYLRIIKESTVTVTLLTAKTKLAPVKQQTIPRLELCGALLLARLYRSIEAFCELLASPTLPPIFFTDSAVVLAWINTPTHKLKVYVGNRVTQIHDITPVVSWKHVDGKSNPSDCGSRGLLPQQLMDHELWWKGPPWLAFTMDKWPSSKVEYSVELPEMKRDSSPTTSLFSCTALPHLIDWMSRFSSYRTLIRVTALILRIIHNKKCPDKRSGSYLLLEISQAFHACVHLVQLYGFFQGDLNNIAKVVGTYNSLSPFLDHKGILRVGGRLENAAIPSSHKHQILLPYDSHFSTLLVDYYHKVYFHPGPNLLQALLQTRFWIPSVRRLIRQRTRKCLKCFKLRAKSIIPSMGNLPDYRLNQTRAFVHCGIDFAGPFLMRDSQKRKAQTSKIYLCLYICMASKAVHLEAVTNLSTEAFLAAFERFMSRRGLPCAVYTDCGTNFAGAARELKLLEEWYNKELTQRNIRDFSTQHSIEWYFNPPYSPHFGGLWEAGIKSVKRHLNLVAGDTPMTYEEISTLFAKIEAILNSRPLCPLSDDPTESDYLSPGHFLIGSPLVATPEPTLLDTRMNQLSRWQLIKRLSEEVWARWRLEYLSTLQKRTKWHRDPARGLQEGDLVLLKTKEAPPLRWPVGKVLQTHPGKDGQVRVVTLRTPTSTYKRTTANLIPLLPLLDDSEVDQC